MKRKCDICRKQEEKERPFMRIFKQTTKTYTPKKEDYNYCKEIIRTKQVWLCPECYLVKVKRRKITKAVEEKK